MKKKLKKGRKNVSNIRKHKLTFILFCLSILSYGGYISRDMIARATISSFYSVTRTLGFVVSDIYIRETGDAPYDRRIKRLCLNKGDVIFAQSTSEIFTDLLKNPWIKTLTVHKGMPNKVYIDISYKKAIALFQKESQFALVAEDGKFIEFINRKKSKWNLPLITGAKSNIKANEILINLKSYPHVYSKIKALAYIRERRWDIILSNGLTIKLPENNISRALESLEIMLRRPGLNKNSVNVIDMRVKDKVIFSGSKVVNQNDKKNIKV